MKLSFCIPNTNRWQGWSGAEDDMKPLGLGDGKPGPRQILPPCAHPEGGMPSSKPCLPPQHALLQQDLLRSRRVSQRGQSQHIGGIRPACLQQLHVANNNDNTATDQILTKSRSSVHLEGRRHFLQHMLLM